MDKKKMINWIDNVLNEDGENLSYGSVRTLSDLKREIISLPSHNLERCVTLPPERKLQ